MEEDFETITDEEVFFNDKTLQLEKIDTKENKIDKSESNKKLKNTITILLWLLFILIVSIVMYIMINNSAEVSKIINKVL